MNGGKVRIYLKTLEVFQYPRLHVGFFEEFDFRIRLQNEQLCPKLVVQNKALCFKRRMLSFTLLKNHVSGMLHDHVLVRFLLRLSSL